MADLGKDNLNSGSSAAKIRSNFLAQPKFLKAPVLNNPFAKVVTDGSSSKIDNPFASISSTPNESLNEAKTESNNTNDTNKTKENDAVPKFVPLHTSKESISFAGGTVTTAKPTGLSRAGGFVFGQNLKERIVGGPENIGEGTSTGSAEHSTTNGASDFLFAAAVQASSDSQLTLKDDGNSLAKSAHIWERVRDTSGPVVPPPQRVLTGEEGEINQLQMNCRLFAFEGGLWKERGRAQLRLNDSQTGSRLVCRSSGSFRVLLNTKIWAGMTVERPGSKSLRVTATDSQQQLKVFLIMASPDEISLLYKSLTKRVEQATQTDNSCDNLSKDTTDLTEENNLNLPDDEKLDALPSNNKLVDGEETNDLTEDVSNLPNTSKNPVVVISAEEDDNSKNREVLKRSSSGERTCLPKKMCMEFPSEDDAQL